MVRLHLPTWFHFFRHNPCCRSRRTLHLEQLDSRCLLSVNPLAIQPSLSATTLIEYDGDRTTIRGWDVAVEGDGPESTARHFLSLYHDSLGMESDVNGRLELVEVKYGLASSHVRFRQIESSLPVHDATVSVHMGPDREIQTVHSSFRSDLQFASSNLVTRVDLQDALEAAAAHARVESEFAAPRHELVWVPQKEGNATLAWHVTVFGASPQVGDFVTLVDADSGDVLWQENHAAFDTGSGYVYEPNPYQTQGSGAGMVDNNDANNTALTNERILVTLQGLDPGTGLLRGEFADLSSLNSSSLPDIDANEPSRVYDYTRNDDRFEQVVVYHSIDSVQRYFHALGFDDDTGAPNGIRDFPTLANAHWYTADQSFYSTGDDAVHFGDGGVDDAEDADIVAHEYGHAVQHDQNVFWGGGEMGAMGEGFGDYLAASFYADFGDPTFQSLHAAAVGEWDAVSYSSANPPNLRRVDGNKHYPEDLVGQVHADGEIWSAALWDIRQILGGPTTDQLVLESHFALPAGATMRVAANAILQADANLNGGANEAVIMQQFDDRGILADLPPDDHGNDANSATSVQVDTTVGAGIQYGGDVDYFQFATVGGRTYRFETILQGLPDSTLTLYSTNGTTELRFDDDGGPGLASRINNWVAPTTGDYFLKVAAYSGSQTGGYSLKLTTTAASDDHGNNAASATPVAANSSTAGELELAADVDWFAFQVDAGDEIVMETTLGTLADSYLRLYDTNGTMVLQQDDNGGVGMASRIDWTAPGSGTYYVSVDNVGAITGTYELSLTVTSGLAGDFNNDGNLNCDDVDALVAVIASGSNDLTYELTGDSLVNTDDLNEWLALAGAQNLASGNPYLLGDANLDGFVDGSDFDVWNGNKFTTQAAWCRGDFNANGVIDGADFGIWNTHKFSSAAARVTALPQPATIPWSPSTPHDLRALDDEFPSDVGVRRIGRLSPAAGDVPDAQAVIRHELPREAVRAAAVEDVFALFSDFAGG